MWETKGFTESEYEVLVRKTAKHRLESGELSHEWDDESLVFHTSEGRCLEGSNVDLERFNDSVHTEMEMQKIVNDSNRTRSQKYEDYTSDYANDN